jgi:hypothetical protein
MAHIAARLTDHYQSIFRKGQLFPVPVLEDMATALPTIKPTLFLQFLEYGKDSNQV